MADGIYRHRRKNINVMTQPFGTLWSFSGKSIWRNHKYRFIKEKFFDL